MCVEHLGSAPKKGGCVTVLLVCPGWPTDASVFWAHGLLFVDGAMCSHVYCLSPPILLPNHCFSWSTCVPLLPSFVSLFSLLVFVVLCWSVVFRRLCYVNCTTVLCLPVYPLRGDFCLSLFYFVIKKPDSPAFWVLAISLLMHPDRYLSFCWHLNN